MYELKDVSKTYTKGRRKVVPFKHVNLVIDDGEFLTVQEMAGFQMFAAKMDDELLHYWKAPCSTPALTVR